MARHVCHAEGCDTAVPPKLFMCKYHWRLLPKYHKDRIWDAYVPGQEVRKDPTEKYVEVARAAIEWMANYEGRRQPQAGFSIAAALSAIKPARNNT